MLGDELCSNLASVSISTALSRMSLPVCAVMKRGSSSLWFSLILGSIHLSKCVTPLRLAGVQERGLQDHGTEPVSYLRKAALSWLLASGSVRSLALHISCSVVSVSPSLSLPVLTYLALFSQSHPSAWVECRISCVVGVLVSGAVSTKPVSLSALIKFAPNVNRAPPSFLVPVLQGQFSGPLHLSCLSPCPTYRGSNPSMLSSLGQMIICISKSDLPRSLFLAFQYCSKALP